MLLLSKGGALHAKDSHGATPLGTGTTLLDVGHLGTRP